MKYLCFAVWTVLLMSGRLFAQSGTLDSTYGVNGVLDFPVGSERGYYELTAVDSQRRVVAVSHIWVYDSVTYAYYTKGWNVYRFTEWGQPDASFGVDGKMVSENDSVYWSTLFLFEDGSMLLGGAVRGMEVNGLQTADAFLLKLRSDGTPDPDFGTNGAFTLDLGENERIGNIAVQPDGKLLASGSTGYYYWTIGYTDVVLMRLHPDGTLDETFGLDGVVTDDLTTSGWDADRGGPMLVQPDGEIVVTCINESGQNSSGRYALRRYLTDGTLDTTFAQNGQALNPHFGSLRNVHIRSKANGALLLISSEGEFSSGTYVTVRQFTPDGIIDSTFADYGVYQSALNDYAWLNDAVVQDDQKILAVGSWGDYYGEKGFLLRLTASGTPDSSFSDDGYAFLENNAGFSLNGLNHVLLYPDQRITVLGVYGQNSYEDFPQMFLARFNNAPLSPVREPVVLPLVVYPNPATDQLVVLASIPTGEFIDISLFDNAGRLVLQKTLTPSDNVINLTSLPPGVYWAVARQNNRTMTGKFVKQ